VIVTDDDGTGEQPAALRALWKADAVVLGVIVRKPRSGPVYVANYVYMGMRNIAVKTGGDSIDTGDAAEGIREMVHRVRQRYSLYYAMPQVLPGEERKVEVHLTRQAAAQHLGAVVRARSGYFAPQ